MTVQINSVQIAAPTGPAYGEQLRIGLIALAADIAIERDFHRLAADDDVSVFTSRIRQGEPNSEATFRAFEADIPQVAHLILPNSRLDVVVFACTAASMLIGAAQIEAAVQLGRPGVAVTNPATAVTEALRAVGARRIAILTPYTPSVTETAVAFMQGQGFEVHSVACLGIDLDDTHARISEEVLYQQALELDWKSVDAIFLSCTAIRSLNVIERLERATGKVVITSNQATFWHALRLGKASPSVQGFGRLFEF
ncbi:aspartate/glutamate racemase family protein [Pseudomonas sp. WJP1]|uniref:maleate cis-trans isomerase family protein n=1 Tax=Pseudomonas sp. WJP1 TaxID=2986947 RepID=UPI00234AF374|nr:aspartate/glutamate racemase family protein [Pseudomonas sp. WJP1]WCM48550.1 aspartate/glutamate racemase family protein [Pseudomonas sp. WJP1]